MDRDAGIQPFPLTHETAGLAVRADGSIVVADNTGVLFSPEAYLTYVRTCGRYDSESREARIEYSRLPDAVEISVYRGPDAS